MTEDDEMYAVIKTGGKQYRVAAGDEFTIERLAAEPGETVQFGEVLMIGGAEGEAATVGAPFVEGAAVQAEVVEQLRGPKVYNFKRRRRKHSSKRLKGHRQDLTSVRITEILTAGGAETGVKAAVGQGAAKREARAANTAAAAE
ncbi:50S ribosomal protein L21 [Paralimibaculum aggregatum]|uniref:Large ribosomal subunit protein bL21 n=1 Tax=Paralimibaculum aggregatum TaxID=3036245 RepID=A0ABQ6LIY2_9RHOB|nr:50S ribosomal protein L21 [Limibaculum sp. NKW23]